MAASGAGGAPAPHDDDDAGAIGYGAVKADGHSLASVAGAHEGDDDAMAKYKATLLGQAANAAAVAADPETRQVVIHEIRIESPGRPDFVIPLESAEAVAAAEAKKIVVKEGTAFSFRIVFSVHKDIVNGLKLTYTVKRMGMKVDSTTTVIGSYAPNAAERYNFGLPEDEWPSGMMARGSYSVKFTFADEDGNTHLIFRGGVDIKKEWE